MGRKKIFADGSDKIRLQVNLSKDGINRLDDLAKKLGMDRANVVRCALAGLDDSVEKYEKEGVVPILISPPAKFV